MIAADENPDPTPDASPALDGYLYQLDVSIWTALELLLARRVARLLILEPVSKEDLEADISTEPGALTQSVDLGSYRLIIQCKLRNTGSWKHGDLTRLLAHGTKRPSARERLSDPDIRYLLVTNAEVDGVARGVRVGVLGEWPAGAEMSKEMADALPTGSAGRVAVLAAVDEEKLRARTETVLTTRFRVPWPKVEDCKAALREAALLRMRGAGAGIWTREQIEELVLKHGGSLGQSEVLEGFVPPKNWEQIKELLKRQHAVIIAGPSGSGKTRAAKALLAELSEQLPGLSAVYVSGGPEKIQQDTHKPPVAFEIEDPWGRFRLEPSSVPWNDAIKGLLQSAGPARQFVITSRSDVLRESGPKSLREKWFVQLTEEHYGATERVRLFENRLKRLPHRLQAAVLHYRQLAVDRLGTPMEMERYFDALMDGPNPDEHDRPYIHRCLSEAQQESIESSILNNVRKRQDFRWAAVVWGLFKARARQSFSVLPSIQAGLTGKDAEFEDGLEPYLNFLIAGRNIRQSEATLTYYHPRVELGLEQAMNEKPELASRALRYLVEVLVAFDAADSQDWGREGAAHLAAAAKTQTKLRLNLTPSTQTSLDAWVRERLASIGPNFQDNLKLAAAVGSTGCLPAELARWLTNTKAENAWYFLDMWSEGEHTGEWYEKVSADPATRSICEAFIRRLLTNERMTYPKKMVQYIGRLAADLAPAFREAALSMVRHGYNHNDDVVAAGALADIDAFEVVVRDAVAYLDELRGSADDDWLAIANGEYDDDAAEHFMESRGEEGSTAGEFLNAYVAARRERNGWTALRDHPQSVGLASAWLHVCSKEDNVSDDEWAAVAGKAVDSPHEAWFWEHAARSWRAVFSPCLVKRLMVGSSDSARRIAAVRVLPCLPSSDLDALFRTLVESNAVLRILELASDLNAAVLDDKKVDALLAVAQKLIAVLSGPLAEAARILNGSAVSKGAPGKDCLDVLSSVDAGGNIRLKLAQACAFAAAGVDARKLIAPVLASTDHDQSEIGVVADAMSLAASLGCWDMVEAGLGHRVADVRERALIALAANSTESLPSKLLVMSADKGHRVRSALLRLLKARPHPEHIEALLQLAADTWTPERRDYGEQATFPIAREAAEIIGEPPTIEDRHVAALVGIAAATADDGVARGLLSALIRNGSDEGRRHVMQLALDDDTPRLNRLAAQSAACETAHVDADLASIISPQDLLRKPASVAAPLAIVVGGCAASETVTAVAQAVATSNDRRALLVPLWYAVVGREPSIARTAAGLLPEELGRALSAVLKCGHKLPRNSLETLGDVRLIREILLWCNSIFEKA